MSDNRRRSSRLSNASTSSNTETGWYLIYFPKVGTDGSYGIYKQSQFKIQSYSNGIEAIKVNNLQGYHGFEVLRIGSHDEVLGELQKYNSIKTVVIAQSNNDCDQDSSSEEEVEDDDDVDDVFVIESTDKNSNKNKKISNKSKATDSKSMNNKKSHDAKFNFRKRVHVISQSSQSSRSNLSSRSSICSTSSSDGSGSGSSSCRRKSSSSSLSSDDDTVTRKDGKPLKKRLLGVATPKRQRFLSSSDEDFQAKSSVSKEKQYASQSRSKRSKSKEKASKKRGRPSLKDLKKRSKRSKSKEKVDIKRGRPSEKDLKKRSKTTAAKEKVSNSGDRIKIKKLKRKANEKSKYQSQLDSKDRLSSTDTSILVESSSDEDTPSQFFQNAKVQPLKAFKSSLEQKISKQDTRITAIENNMNEEDEIFNGKNLNDIFASTGQKLAIKLARAMKGDSLKDYVLTENGEESANSDRMPWTTAEIAVFRKVMMRKCKLNSEQFSKKYSSYKTAVNSRSRYDYRQHLKRLGIKPNSKRARIFSKSKKNRFHISSDEEEDSRSTFKKKRVSFSSPLSQTILDDTLGASAEASPQTVVSTPSTSTATQQSNLSSTSSLTGSDTVNSINIQQSQLMATPSPTIPDSSASSLPSNQPSVLNGTNAQKLLQSPLNKNAHQNQNNEE